MGHQGDGRQQISTLGLSPLLPRVLRDKKPSSQVKSLEIVGASRGKTGGKTMRGPALGTQRQQLEMYHSQIAVPGPVEA